MKFKLEKIQYDKEKHPTNILNKGLYSMKEEGKYVGKVTSIGSRGGAILDGGPGRITNEGLIRSWRGEDFYMVGPVIEKGDKSE